MADSPGRSPSQRFNVRITNRHKWIIQTVAQTFGVNDKDADSFIRERESQEVLEPFFNKNGPRRVMAFHQPVGPDKENKLFLTDGTSDQLTGKACYFLRIGEEDVNLDVFSDASVVDGRCERVHGA